MKKILLLITLTVALYAQHYTMTPDGSFVNGSTFTLTPDGSYVGGSNFTLTPDGNYIGGN